MAKETLKDRLAADQDAALRARDETRLRTIRSLRAAIQTQEIATRKGNDVSLDDDAVLAVLTKQAKQRRDSISQFQDAGRTDLVKTEEAELEIIEAYLPSQLSDDELKRELTALVSELGVSDMSGMGRVMGQAMGKLRGRADGKRVQAAVRAILSGS